MPMPATRRLLSSLVTISALALSAPVSADVLGLRAGIEYWQADLLGEAQSSAARARKAKPVQFDDWEFYGETYNSLWINFEHPVPFVPNLRMTYTNIENAKTKYDVRHVSGSVFWYTDDTAALIFDNIDFTFYYEVLDNWINLDVGLTARSLNGEFELISTTPNDILSAPVRDYTKLNEIVPMVYLNGRFDIPFMEGLYVQSVINGITDGTNTLYDADVRVGYTFELAVFDIGVYGGYRRMTMETTDLGNLYTNAYMDGLFTGLEAHF
jgi:outer membrane protein